MNRTQTLVQILGLAIEVSHETLIKETIIALGQEYNIIPNTNRYTSIQEIRLYTPLSHYNRITAIKELRERAMENGLSYGLKECKEEVDRRITQLGNENNW